MGAPTWAWADGLPVPERRASVVFAHAHVRGRGLTASLLRDDLVEI